MSKPKWMNEKSPSKLGRLQEEKARKHVNSGAVWFDQYDLDIKEGDDNYLVDVKNMKKSITLSDTSIKKLFQKAMQEGKTPAYLIYMGDYTIKAVITRSPSK